jgi:hypothetical protein
MFVEQVVESAPCGPQYNDGGKLIGYLNSQTWWNKVIARGRDLL